MKKAFAMILALALVLCASPAFADSSLLTFKAPDPTYFISIPSEIALGLESTDVAITASEVSNLLDGRISVTVAGTDKPSNLFRLDGVAPSGQAYLLYYNLTSASGEFYPVLVGSQVYTHVGAELASFEGDGVQNFQIELADSGKLMGGTEYTGTLIYGIGVVYA